MSVDIPPIDPIGHHSHRPRDEQRPVRHRRESIGGCREIALSSSISAAHTGAGRGYTPEVPCIEATCIEAACTAAVHVQPSGPVFGGPKKRDQ